MPTIINSPGNAEESGSNLVLAIILVIVLMGATALFFIYGLPMIQNSYDQNPGSTNINVTVPATPAPTP